MMSLIFLAPALVLMFGDGKQGIPLCVTGLVTWLGAMVAELVFINGSSNTYAVWLFFWGWLPIVTALLAGITASMIARRKRYMWPIAAAWLAALAGVFLGGTSPTPHGVIECIFDVMPVVLLAASGAVGATMWSPRFK